MQARPKRLNIKNVAKPVRRRKKRNGRIPYSAMVRQVGNDVARIYSMFNTELKYQDYIGSSVQGTTMTQVLVNGLTQGTTSTTRLGDTIRVKTVELNMRISISTTSTLGYVTFRVLLLRDTQPNGATFGPGNYLNTPTNVLSTITMAQCKRFHTVDDQMFIMDSNGPQAVLYRRVYNIDFHPEYGLGNAGTIADLSKDALFLCFLSDDNTNQPGYSYWTRLHFIDN